MDYKAPDNIYWLFSSSAQAIAAFIGFVAAGFFFFHDRVSKEVEKDETLEEIYAEIRKQSYYRLRVLFFLTGVSIVLSLTAVYLNGFDLGSRAMPFHIVVALINFWTIVQTITFVTYVVDPERVKRTTTTLIDQDKKTFQPVAADAVSAESFVSQFMRLENLVRKFAERHELISEPQAAGRRFMPMGEIVRRLGREHLISDQQMNELRFLSRVRNLAVHGGSRQLDERVAQSLERMISHFEKIG